ncbi:hypothetical protein SERLA73DRAFT_117156 [Serpula lacrymans var. lacrymans S7.3]|uniref:DUF4110 domain-containing protein n=2 Tax=Serpula lacrymans var. lacrymans TaxID=341189 RepID=F8QGK9_SERL3|nr:uncharacterized protein SERLADRAFT_445130 [Serpula lacrymans var. lacrymans S7.9]EGN92555.1 hypothetical protein SERLA73DRAFT_117156 [Serpula lacrymans var. lacrymans S7.3]EGO29301.1 hypothetical protein SERLADRAFT_445130 [Serpula lacrymans var. lacrymans S7.9]
MRREWEEAHTVTEELVEGPPSRRANATLTACPNGNHLWCIGGEFFSEDGKAYFYNDMFRYAPDKDEWRKFVSPTCPGPRSAHAVVASPAGGGKLFLFGGEFSSLYQNNFHHYRDFWCFDISTHSWDRIDTKLRPSGRSGHRMAMWKHYIVLFGGFIDPGFTTHYLNDTWIFDTQEYKWKQIEFKETDRKPSPRSGFSFLPTVEGVVLHGGYCKEYAKGKRPVGVMLDDTWFLKISMNTVPDGKSLSFSPLSFKWEKRKKSSTAYAPSLRSGCTMTPWTSKGMGILFGGVTDEDTSEETLESTFWNDLYGYQLAGNGRWISMTLKRPKKGGSAKKKKPVLHPPRREEQDEERNSDAEDYDEREHTDTPVVLPQKDLKGSSIKLASTVDTETDTDDPMLSLPLPRYNAMLAVLRNTLYIYGGIFECGSREYTLDDFHSLQLDKMDRYVCLKSSGITIPAEGADESSSEDDDDDDEEDDDDDSEDDERRSGKEMVAVCGEGKRAENNANIAEVSEITAEPPSIENESGASDLDTRDKDDLRAQATVFMGVAKDTTRTAEDVISTPLPGETLAMFYARSREYWAQKAHGTSDNRGKMLRRDGFGLAEDRYASYKPILEEVEKILAEAGLDEDEMRMGAAGADAGSGMGQSRNRR